MSEDPDFVFHRTLLPYASQPRRATIEEPRFLQTPKEPFPAFPIRPVTTPPRAQAFNPSFKSVPLNGYQIVVPGSLTSRVFQVDPDGLPDADGRHFAQYATPWERLRSKICSRGFRFLPVVDHDHVVVGHAGRVSGYDLLIAVTANTSPTDLADAMQHARLYVSSSPPGTTPPQGMKRWGFSDDIYDVVTAIDGEVVTGGLAYSRGVQEDDHILADPLLAWSVMRVAARFALKAGAFVVRSVGRRIARRTILDGARAEILATSASSPYARGLKTSIGYDARMGIPPEHFEPMAAAAREANGIAVFRANKSAAIDLIRKGAAPKPKAFNDFKSSLTTGVVTAKTSGHFKTVWEQGYLVIEEDFVARRRVGSVVVQEMKVERPYWTVEQGQVLTAQGVPVVGDYDLLGFLPLESPGRNIALVPENPETGDWIGPDVKRYAKALNAKLDMPRIMHGAMEGLKSKQYPGFIEEITYAVFPDGHSYVMEGKAAAEDFYKLFGRDAARWHAEVVPRALGFPDLEVLNGGKK